MNHLKFWGSRSSSKTRDVKEEAKASEPRKAEDKPEEPQQEPLDVVAPQVEVTEPVADDGTTEEKDQEEPAQAGEAETKPTGEKSKKDTVSPSAAVEKDIDGTNAPGLPGGASTSAPHKEEDVSTTEEKSSKEDKDTLEESTAQEDAKPAEEEQSQEAATGTEECEDQSTKVDAEEDNASKKNSKRDSAFAGTETNEASSDDLKDAAAPSETQGPLLSEDDEQFLHRLTSEVEPQQAPSLNRRPTEINENGELIEPTDVPLPMSPGNEDGPSSAKTEEDHKTATWRDRWNQWSFVPAAPSMSSFRRAPPKDKKVSFTLALFRFTLTIIPGNR